MNVIPCKLRPGDPLIVNGPDGKEYRATFIQRYPEHDLNKLHSNDWEGLPDVDELGFVNLSDECLIRRSRLAPESDQEADGDR
ncbi:hypothetical protein [Alloalcanivorax xenomutans]|uniref:hypothetical protein n=1 Tax=Alloalcanivorax xenomutans TaxID=1094342 RepID=UPI00300A4FE3